MFWPIQWLLVSLSLPIVLAPLIFVPYLNYFYVSDEQLYVAAFSFIATFGNLFTTEIPSTHLPSQQLYRGDFIISKRNGLFPNSTCTRTEIYNFASSDLILVISMPKAFLNHKSICLLLFASSSVQLD